MNQQIPAKQKTTFLENLPPAECEALEKLSEKRSYPAGTIVFPRGEKVPGIFVVSKGCLKICRFAGKDKMQVLDVIEPGQCCGEMMVVTDTPSDIDAVAVEDTECWLIPVAVIEPILRANPLVSAIFWHLSTKLFRMVPLIEALSLHTVPERVAKMVIDFHDRTPAKSFVEFTDTQEGLARFIGSSREAFNRGLKLLGDLGFIHSTFPVVHITDAAKLRRFAEGV
jgi:CRP-like cAMP-binding protein